MKKIYIIILLTLLFGWLTGKLLDNGYKRFWRPFMEKLDVVLNDSSKRDVVFLGDSRTFQGINPYYIDSVAGTDSYNAAMPGASMNEIYFIAEAWLRGHQPPKLFVISIPFWGILPSETKFENTCQYLFYLNNPMVKKALSSQHYHTSMITIFPILKYTAFDDFNKNTIFRSFFGESFLQSKGYSFKGFVNNNSESFRSSKKISGPSDTAISSGLNKFNDLLILFKKYNCKCLITFPPVITNDAMNFPILNKIDSATTLISKNFKFPIARFDKDTSFNKTSFEDPWHLNIKGSYQYSLKIGYEIKNIFKQKE